MEERERLLQQWHAASEQLAEAKNKEATLRQAVFPLYFEDPVEGTNEVELGNGYVLKGTHKLNRNIDEAALPAVLAKLPAGMEEKLIKYSPRIVMDAYRKLPDKKRKIIEQALIITPGMPSLSIVAPKKKKGGR